LQLIPERLEQILANHKPYQRHAGSIWRKATQMAESVINDTHDNKKEEVNCESKCNQKIYYF